MTDSDSRSIWKRQEQLDTRPLGRDLWVSRRGTQVSKGARPGAPGSDSLGFARDRLLTRQKARCSGWRQEQLDTRPLGRHLWVSRRGTQATFKPSGVGARNPGLERRETWGTRLACGNSNWTTTGLGRRLKWRLLSC